MKNTTIRQVLNAVKTNNNAVATKRVKIYTVSFVKAKTPEAVTTALKTQFSNDPYFEILESFDNVIITGSSHVWEQFYKKMTGVLVSPDISEGSLEILFAGMVNKVTAQFI